MRRRRGWLPALLLAVSLAAPAHAAPKCPVKTSGRFTTIPIPPVLAGAPVEVVPAARRSQPDVLIGMTTRALWRSADGGCTWAVAYSLDTDAPAESRARLNTESYIRKVAVSQNVTGPRTVYALVVDAAGDLTVTMPVSTVVSTDGGAHFRLNEVPVGPALADVPRCTASSTLIASPDPKVAHLVCTMQSLGELFLTVFGPQCSAMHYLTNDGAATWRPLTPKVWDPARLAAADTSGGCTHFTAPIPDPVSVHTLWQVPLCTRDLLRSTDDGKTSAVYATLPAGAFGCSTVMTIGADRGRQSFAVACGASSVFVARSRTFVKAAVMPLRSSQIGSARGCAVDPATGKVLVFYTTGDHHRVVLAYDIARRKWESIGVVPDTKDSPAWDEYGVAEARFSTANRYVYVRKTWAGYVLHRVSL